MRCASPPPFTPSAGSRVWSQPLDANRFLFCWENLLLEGDPQRPSTVQCELDRDGTVRWRYGPLAPGAAEAAGAGVQNLGPG